MFTERKWIAAVLVGASLPLGLCAQETGWGKHKRLFAVPVPSNVERVPPTSTGSGQAGRVTVDGTLDDWDLSGAITVYVQAATKAMQSGTFAVMYDGDALYVAGEVRDPSPMMNRHAPETEGDLAWDADACQFRLLLDPAQGYPIADTTFDRGKKPPNDQIAHLLLWYYTDRKEPNLQMQTSMEYKNGPGSDKFGVLPRDKFHAAYLMADDKRGYTFEYRIPWATLGAKNPPRGGDFVAGTMQYNWGRPDGLKTAGISGWGYDLQAFRGFAYQNAGCWGKVIFSRTGNIAKELVEEGLPPEKPLPLKFEYDLPEEAEVTLALFNADNMAVRTLAAQASRPAGRVVEQWDGLDESDQPIPAGRYRWRGLYHQPIKLQYVLSVHNSGQPAWKTDDNTGAWGGDHSVPTAACALGGDMILTWAGAETGCGLIRTDGEGKRKWGVMRSADLAAGEGERIYLARDHWQVTSKGVVACDARDGRPLLFGNGATVLMPPGGDGKTNAISGLACRDGRLYVAVRGMNQVAVYDALQGDLKATWAVSAPGAMASRPDGSLVALSAGRLVAVAEGKVAPLAADHLDDPQAVAVDAEGLIYVSNWGKLQNVSVFSPDGRFRKSIGKDGGRPDWGRYDPEGMLIPAALAADAKGRLWVPECVEAPRRISVWNAKTGTLAKEFFGAANYSAFIWMDPERPDEIYCDGTMWKVDLDKKTWAPSFTVWRPRGEDSPGMLATHGNGLRLVTAQNGRQYGWAVDSRYGSYLFLRVGDKFKPLAGLFWIKPGVRWPAVADEGKYPDWKTFAWADKNDDQMFQPDEISVPAAGTFRGFVWVDRDLNLWAAKSVFRPLRVEADGRPVYDFGKSEPLPLQLKALDAGDGSVYVEGDPAAVAYGRRQTDGKLLWGYAGEVEDFKRILGLPPQKPGKIWGATDLLGNAGEFTGFNTYFGVFHIYTRDGLFVSMVFRDPRLGGALDYDIISCENYNGQLVRPKGMNRYFALGGDQDGRVCEVLGLDSVKRLPGGEYVITEADAQRVEKAHKDYVAGLSKQQKLVIARGRKGLEAAGQVGKAVKEGMSFQARAAYDDKNLYVQYDIASPTELANGIADPQLVFKGGNLLDIQIATDPAADRKREKPAPGDVRVLVSRRDGKPYAVVYRPRVKGFKGEPIVLRSPTGTESFDAIEVSDKVGLEYVKEPNAPMFKAVATIPMEVLGWRPNPGGKVRADLGYIFGNEGGTKAMARSYWMNNGFSANVLNDVPNESRLTPNEWGEAEVE